MFITGPSLQRLERLGCVRACVMLELVTCLLGRSRGHFKTFMCICTCACHGMLVDAREQCVVRSLEDSVFKNRN